MRQFNAQKLKADIMYEARVVGMPGGTSKPIAEKVAAAVEKWIQKRSAVTVEDINKRVSIEIEQYSPNLSYVYRNRGKIL